MKYLISLVLGLATVSLIEANTCETTRCPAGQVCQMQRVQCVQQPCNDIPVCVENPCNLVDCARGKTCELREVQCFTTPCNPQPTCVDVEHPGTCPKPSGLAGICVFNPEVNCLSDATCAPDEKCCSEGCGRVCKKALPVEHPGTCPRPSGLAGICVFNPEVNCLSDATCAPDEKCCSEGCGSVCKKALHILPGSGRKG